ncbi:uncharacterized protein LOC126844512 [Adelges cooleyi]|uniref:uncharacterized protein LOC126844512 n=1 Tax=Adelges cooleyi TaxID=133065 RepID=UPI00217F3B59|nr:uncharacterized protein LOC126844512 [Adelges cooleyi]
MFTKICIIYFLCTFIFYTNTVDSIRLKTWPKISSLMRTKDKGIVADNDIRRTYDKEFVEHFCRMRTMEAFRLVFEDVDIRSLCNNFDKNKNQLEEKHCALVKYRKKMQALQCHNGVIVQSMLAILKGSIRLRKNETTNGKRISGVFKKFRVYVSRMLSVLYYGKTNPPSWLWLVYVKFLAVTEWDTYRESIEDDLFEDAQLTVDLDNFIDTCVANYYLPVDHEKYEDLIRAKTSVDSLKAITAGLYNNHSLWSTYKFADFFVVDNMYLLEFSNEKPKLFEAVPRMTIEWHYTMVQFDWETAKCKTSLENGVWLKKPFACLDYQNLIVQVVITKLLCYTLVHLLTFRKLKFQHKLLRSSHSDATDTSDFPKYLQKAIGDLKIKEDIFIEIIHLLSSEKNEEVVQFDRIINEVRTVVTRSLIALRVKRVHKDVMENSIKYITNRAENDVILHNCDAMKTFCADILSIIHPVDFEFVNFFLSGTVSFPYTFHYNETIDVVIRNSSKTVTENTSTADLEVAYNDVFLTALCDMKTMETNAITFDTEDLLVLSQGRGGLSKRLRRKQLVSVKKYYEKMQALQCYNGLVVRAMLAFLKGSVVRRRNGDDPECVQAAFGQFKRDVSRMLAVLFNGKTVAHDWLWAFNNRLMAVAEWGKYEATIPDDLFGDRRLNADLSNFISTCQFSGYLPAGVAEDPVVRQAETDMESLQALVDPLYNNYSLSRVYQNEHVFAMSHLYPLELYSSHETLVIFGNVPCVRIEWKSLAWLVQWTRDRCEERLSDGRWMVDAYACVEYHDAYGLVLRAKLLCYALVHLAGWQSLEQRQSQSDITAQTALFLKSLESALDDWKIDDTKVFADICAFLAAKNHTKPSSFDHIVSMALAAVLRILILLGVDDVYHGELVQSIKSIKSVDSDFHLDQFKRNVRSLRTFHSLVTKLVSSVHFQMIHSYRRGRAPFLDTYYFNDTTITI